MRQLTYTVNQAISAAELAVVFNAAGLRRPVTDLVRLEKMLSHADILIAARDEGKLVGVARALSDFSYCCYLSDLAVDPAYQKQGIGQAMIELVRQQIGEQCSLLLLAAPSAQQYYPKLGFEAVDNGWIIRRKG